MGARRITESQKSWRICSEVLKAEGAPRISGIRDPLVEIIHDAGYPGDVSVGHQKQNDDSYEYDTIMLSLAVMPSVGQLHALPFVALRN